MFNIAQEDYNVVKQRISNRYLRLNLLDFQYRTVDEINGNMISCSVSCDADSDLRKSCTVSLVVTDSSFDIKAGGKIFLDRYIQPFVGIENIYTGKIQWYNQGIYLINSPTWRFDAITNTLSFAGLDLMSKLTGVRNGQLEGIPTIIKKDENVREAMIATLALCGFNKYLIDECKLEDGTIQPVPYDIEIDQGGFAYDIISALRDILPQYQVYFDNNGVFHYEKIPTGDDQPVLITDDIWKNLLISEDIAPDFESVKNYIEVYGRTHDIDHYASSIAVTGADLTLTIPSIGSVVENTLIGFTPTVDIAGNIRISISGKSGFANLVDSKGNNITALAKDTYWVANYQANGTWLFLGHLQAQAKYSDTNPDSPFYVDGPVGRIRQVLYGGEYDNIQSDELALERAKLEIYWKCRLNDSINLTLVPIPWMDVNIVVSHAPKNSIEENRYLVKGFSVDYAETGTMTVKLITLYPYYPVY